MDILKFISVFVLFSLLSCIKVEYKKIDDSFTSIHLKDWNSSICPRKIIFERYEKQTFFKKLIDSNSYFEIEGCDLENIKFNQRVFIPLVNYKGQINYDIKLVIDDSLVYRITDIKDGIDTISGKSGPGKWIIMNNIRSLVINGHKLDNSKTPISFNIPTKIWKVYKEIKNPRSF